MASLLSFRRWLARLRGNSAYGGGGGGGRGVVLQESDLVSVLVVLYMVLAMLIKILKGHMRPFNSIYVDGKLFSLFFCLLCTFYFL